MITMKFGFSLKETVRLRLKMTSKEKPLEDFFVEVDEKETSYLGAIYVDFSKYLSSKEPRMSKENSRIFFFFSQVRVSNVRRYLPIFSVKMKIRTISKLILE
jgi:hypothetical protein